jgi:hypothetical protein
MIWLYLGNRESISVLKNKHVQCTKNSSILIGHTFDHCYTGKSGIEVQGMLGNVDS